MAESKASPLGSRSQSPNTASDSGSPTLRKRSYTDMASPPESDKPDTSYKDHSGHGADAVVHDPSLVSQTSTPNDEQHENADDADDAHHPDQDDSSEHEEDSVLEPDAPLKPFDWHDFDAEYHEMIKNKKDEEMKIYADFEDLCQAREALALCSAQVLTNAAAAV